MSRGIDGCRSATHPSTKNVPFTANSSKRSSRRVVLPTTRLSSDGHVDRSTVRSKTLTWKESSTSIVMALMIRAGADVDGVTSGAAAQDHGLHGLEDDEQVERDREVLDVVEVVLQLLQGVLGGRAIGVA